MTELETRPRDRAGDGLCEDVAVVIRAAGERTQALCSYLVEQQVPSGRVVVVCERPFAKALKRSFEIGLDLGLPWTVCLDADVLISHGAVADLVGFAASCPSDILGAQGYLLYKFSHGTNIGCPHLYRTRFLEDARSLVDRFAELDQPERYVKLEMENARGRPYFTFDSILGVHDYDQYYTDIYRKMLARAKKSAKIVPLLLTRALAGADADDDFRVALQALVAGLNDDSAVVLDAEAYRMQAEALLARLGIREKPPLAVGDVSGSLADDLIQAFKLSADYSAHIATAAAVQNQTRGTGLARRLGLKASSACHRLGNALHRWGSA